MSVQPIELSVVIPCYNEGKVLEANAERLVRTLVALPYPAEIIFVDDCSQDETRALLALIRSRFEERIPIQILEHERNRGRGSAVMTGLRAARGQIAGFLDIDLEVDCTYIGPMVAAIKNGSDLSIGKRYYSLKEVKPHRVVLSRGYRFLSRRVLGHPIADTECGFKFFRLDRAWTILDETEARGWFWDTEVMYRAHRAGLTITQVPMRFVRDPNKTSTVAPLRDSLYYLVQLMRFRWKVAGRDDR